MTGKPEVEVTKAGTMTVYRSKDGAVLQIFQSNERGAKPQIVLRDATQTINVSARHVDNANGFGFRVVEDNIDHAERHPESNTHDRVYQTTTTNSFAGTVDNSFGPSVNVINDVGDSVIRHEVQDFVKRHDGDKDFMRAIQNFGGHAYTSNGQDLSLTEMLATPSRFRAVPEDPGKLVDKTNVRQNVIFR